MSYSSPGTGLSTWQVVVLVGLVLLIADIVSIQMIGSRTDHVAFVSAPAQPAPQPAAAIPIEPQPAVMVEVLVAAKDLPVGTTFTKAESQWIKVKRAADSVPAGIVVDEAELIDRRITRAIRAGETFNRKELLKGTGPTLPDGYGMVSLQVGIGASVSGFVVPGSRVDILATVCVGDKLRVFQLLVNVLVVAVETTSYAKDGLLPTTNVVSFAVREKEESLLTLAKSRGCNIQLILRNSGNSTETDKNHDIDAVIKLLSDIPGAAVEVAPAPRAVGGER